MSRNHPAGPSDENRVLQQGANALGVDLSEAQCETLLRYLDLISVWNRAAGLTTIPRRDGVRLHLLDSLAAAWAVSGGPCADLGTGAGLPGMVLAVARPEVAFFLVESNRKRCSFLLEVLRVLKIPNVRVIESAVESLDPDTRYATVVSRAFRPPGEFLRIARDVVTPGGDIVLLLADPDESELRSLEEKVGIPMESVRRLRLPEGSEPRTVVRFRTA